VKQLPKSVGAGNPHATFCGNRGRATASGDPVAGVRLPCATHRNIYVRSRRAGERVMASVSRFLTQKLRLKVNEAKSAVARPEERKFLGFSISNDGSERRIAPNALNKFKMQVRAMTRRTRGISLPQLAQA
jgi:RNA-directed DNA polymerase